MVSPVIIRPALVIFVVTAIIFIAIALTRNRSNPSAPVQSAFRQLPPNIDIALNQAHFSEMKHGLIVWELVAERVEYDKTGEIAHLTGGIRVDFAGGGRHGAIKAVADRGEYHSNNNDIKLRGTVNVQTGDGASFITDSIDYSAANYQLKTAEAVTFRQGRLTLKATGLEMNTREQKTRFLNLVEATVSGAP